MWRCLYCGFESPNFECVWRSNVMSEARTLDTESMPYIIQVVSNWLHVIFWRVYPSKLLPVALMMIFFVCGSWQWHVFSCTQKWPCRQHGRSKLCPQRMNLHLLYIPIVATQSSYPFKMIIKERLWTQSTQHEELNFLTGVFAWQSQFGTKFQELKQGFYPQWS